MSISTRTRPDCTGDPELTEAAERFHAAVADWWQAFRAFNGFEHSLPADGTGKIPPEDHDEWKRYNAGVSLAVDVQREAEQALYLALMARGKRAAVAGRWLIVAPLGDEDDNEAHFYDGDDELSHVLLIPLDDVAGL